jgi:hypothetical protein
MMNFKKLRLGFVSLMMVVSSVDVSATYDPRGELYGAFVDEMERLGGEVDVALLQADSGPHPFIYAIPAGVSLILGFLEKYAFPNGGQEPASGAPAAAPVNTNAAAPTVAVEQTAQVAVDASGGSQSVASASGTIASGSSSEVNRLKAELAATKTELAIAQSYLSGNVTELEAAKAKANATAPAAEANATAAQSYLSGNVTELEAAEANATAPAAEANATAVQAAAAKTEAAKATKAEAAKTEQTTAQAEQTTVQTYNFW